ncbi:DUF4174 domain-containing protein [Aliiroseovarius subalbicans]|uniref:DUF4174 domain-containing protein n=1 Tax=Aliiroseovarius subalbicans TaxID=2925840 RepID=UPI001F59959E|nr:DUF4174 domain-containing protein [Aliiroseovarius subalbicans]MCI2400768.1 DUF4174 domain-containing protein [Aliiroseovarius subalbicans]
MFIRAAFITLLTALPAVAVDATVEPWAPVPAGDHVVGEYHWTHRLLVVFADSPNDPRFIQQLEAIADDPEELTSRDVIVITDTDPAADSAIREDLRPRGFAFVLIGKDGAKYLRKPVPWTLRELTRSIDKMPLRQQELRDMRAR